MTIRRLLALLLSVSVAAAVGCGSSSSSTPAPAGGEQKTIGKSERKFEPPPPVQPIGK